MAADTSQLDDIERDLLRATKHLAAVRDSIDVTKRLFRVIDTSMERVRAALEAVRHPVPGLHPGDRITLTVDTAEEEAPALPGRVFSNEMGLTTVFVVPDTEGD